MSLMMEHFQSNTIEWKCVHQWNVWRSWHHPLNGVCVCFGVNRMLANTPHIPGAFVVQVRFYPSLRVNNELLGLTFSLDLQYWCVQEHTTCHVEMYTMQNCYIIENHQLTMIIFTSHQLHLYLWIEQDKHMKHTHTWVHVPDWQIGFVLPFVL